MIVVLCMALSNILQENLGLYEPLLDKDACGVGFVAELLGKASQKTIMGTIEMLKCLSHCGTLSHHSKFVSVMQFVYKGHLR